MPPKALNGTPLSNAERQRRYGAKRRNSTEPARSISPDLGRSDHTTDEKGICQIYTLGGPQRPIIDLSLDAESIAAVIIASVPETKADAIAKSINQRLVVWRCGSFDLRLVPRRT